MSILIIGGSGFLGRHLCQSLLGDGKKVTIQTRSQNRSKKIFNRMGYCPEIIEALDDEKLNPSNIEKVIVLSGAGIVDRRWTQNRKDILINSRVQPQLELKDWLNQNNHSVKQLLIGSAIGYYGFHQNPDHEFSENSEPIDHFVHQLCHQIEQTSSQLKECANNIVQLRTGVVLGKQGGALQKMRIPAKFHLNGPIGKGKQWVSWIHLHDWINAVKYILSLDTPRRAYNLTSPQASTNAQMSTAIANSVGKPFQLPIPSLSLKLLLGEASVLLTGSQKVIPSNLQAANFEFLYPDIEETCQNLIRS